MNDPEPDAQTAMAIGSDPTTTATDITYNMGPQVQNFSYGYSSKFKLKNNLPFPTFEIIAGLERHVTRLLVPQLTFSHRLNLAYFIYLIKTVF